MMLTMHHSLHTLAAFAVAVAVLAATPSHAQDAPVPQDTSTAVAAAKCEPLPRFAGGQDALRAAGAKLVARAKQSPIGSAAHTSVKIEVMSLFVRAGDLEMCKLLRQTRTKHLLSTRQMHDISCLQQQFCRPMPLPYGCPAGMFNDGPEGCAPRRSCTAAGIDAQVAACTAGDTSCCAPALLVLEIADAEAGMPTEDSLARRRALVKIGCDAGHAELCLEAAAFGVGTAADQRARACSLGHVASCAPSGDPL